MSEERDFVLARLAAARGFVGMIQSDLDDCLQLFLGPEEDKDGKQREEAIAIMVDSAGLLSRSLEAAQEMLSETDPKEEEPDLPEGDEFDEEEGDEENA